MAEGKIRSYRAFTRKHIDEIAAKVGMSPDEAQAMKAVAAVLPFRVNNYVIEDLINWNDIPDDPIFQLTFPHQDMLESQDFERMLSLVRGDAPASEIQTAAREIQRRMNPNPSGQKTLNVPTLDGEPLPGMQHKYRETVLFFPSHGQTCHAYCTYCFRWAQFVGMEELKFANRQAESLVRYLGEHPEVTDVLFTGGDPLIMKTRHLRAYIEPLLRNDSDRPFNIRLGSKAPAYWPQRFLTDPDADDLLRLFEEVVASGRHLALMAHFSHPRELETPEAEAALRRVVSTGAVVRCQAPLIRHVNDDPNAWSQLWEKEVRLGAIPYYMFVERDTGPKSYFEVPLARAFRIFSAAHRRVSGLARTVRGPSMSATPGKVLVDGVCEVAGEKVFVLKFIQARDPSWVSRPFFARYDPRATWLDDLTPAFGENRFFFEKGARVRPEARRLPLAGRLAPATGF